MSFVKDVDLGDSFVTSKYFASHDITHTEIINLSLPTVWSCRNFSFIAELCVHVHYVCESGGGCGSSSIQLFFFLNSPFIKILKGHKIIAPTGQQTKTVPKGILKTVHAHQ